MDGKGTVVVGLSGGVDSAVAAALLLERGFRVVGATLKLKHHDPAFAALQTCAAAEDASAVEAVAAALGIEHHFLDGFADFEREVLLPAAREYLGGRTPNPCCFCNPAVKFGKLLELADSLGAEAVATGHYVRLAEEDGHPCLRRGADPVKDQSYFLYRLTPFQLARVRFPLGDMTKDEVRRIARSLALPVAARPDSQDACFASENECFGETLRRVSGLRARPGVFVFQGRIVGRHAGVHCYTIGQRKGLNIALGRPAYISRIDSRSGEIELVTDEKELMRTEFQVNALSFQQQIPECFDCLTQIRYRGEAVPCMVEREGDSARVTADMPVKAVTPGQSAVFYSGDLLLGGGVIE